MPSASSRSTPLCSGSALTVFDARLASTTDLSMCQMRMPEPCRPKSRSCSPHMPSPSGSLTRFSTSRYSLPESLTLYTVSPGVHSKELPAGTSTSSAQPSLERDQAPGAVGQKPLIIHCP